jgi:hypothetical protein
MGAGERRGRFVAGSSEEARPGAVQQHRVPGSLPDDPGSERPATVRTAKRASYCLSCSLWPAGTSKLPTDAGEVERLLTSPTTRIGGRPSRPGTPAPRIPPGLVPGPAPGHRGPSASADCAEPARHTLTLRDDRGARRNPGPSTMGGSRPPSGPCPPPRSSCGGSRCCRSRRGLRQRASPGSSRPRAQQEPAERERQGGEPLTRGAVGCDAAWHPVRGSSSEGVRGHYPRGASACPDPCRSYQRAMTKSRSPSRFR